MYFCRSWFSNMVSFRYVLVFLNFLHDIFSIKFYTISFLCKHNFFIGEKHTQWMLDTKVKVFHEMTLKLYFMKCSERKISQCILPFMYICVYTLYISIYISAWLSYCQLLAIVKETTSVSQSFIGPNCLFNLRWPG